MIVILTVSQMIQVIVQTVHQKQIQTAAITHQNIQQMKKSIINQKGEGSADSCIHSTYNFLINLLYGGFFF